METHHVKSLRRWDELIPDTLGLIFKHLPLHQVLTVIPRVCKSWHRAVEGPYCWQVIDIEEWSMRCNPMQLDRLIRMLINRSSGSVKELRVSHVINDKTLSFIADNAGSLHTLSFKFSPIGDSIGELVPNKFSNLTSLDLSYCSNITIQTFESIGRNCKSLSTLRWNMKPHFTDISFESHSVNQVRAIARTMPRLRQLEVAYHHIDITIVHEIIKGCPELELLNLMGCKKVSELEKKALEEKYPALKVLGLMVPMGHVSVHLPNWGGDLYGPNGTDDSDSSDDSDRDDDSDSPVPSDDLDRDDDSDSPVPSDDLDCDDDSDSSVPSDDSDCSDDLDHDVESDCDDESDSPVESDSDSPIESDCDDSDCSDD